MANSDKNIRIITNKNKSSLPNITFTGYNNDPVVLNVLDDNTISFEGSSGQLFSVSNSVTSGTIFSVNDISGIPSFRIDADGTVGIAEFSGNVGIGLQSPQSKLSVGGDINASIGYSYRINGTMVLNASSLGTGVTLSALTSVGTVSSGTWQGSPIGVIYGGTGGSSASDARSILGAATAGTNSDLTRLLGVQHLFVTIPTSAAIGITVKAAVSQSASLMEFVNSSNSPMSWITKDGTFAHGAYFTHSDGRIPGISVQRSNAAGIVARGFNSDAFPAIEVQNNGGGLGVGLYPGGLVYGGVLQAYSSTASTNTTTGALIVAGGAGIAGSLNTSTSFSSSISGLRILNASLSSSTGTIAATNKIQVTVSDSDAFLVRNGGGTNIFDIDTSNSVISVLPSTGSTNSSTGALVVTGGVGIGGTLNARSVYVDNDLMHTPGVGNTFTNSWTSITFPSGFSASRIIYAENKFVAIGGSVVVYSSDLINWTTSFIPWPSALSCQAITNGNGYYAIMPSQSAYVAYSSDLLNWGIGSVTYQNYGSITYGNGRFLANSGAVVGISTNGTNWGSFTPNGNIGGGTLSYHNGYFYTPTARSVDGINWESLNIPITVTNIQYGNGLYFGAQYNSSNYTYSTDGLNFTSATIENNVYVGADYHNGVYYLRTQHNVARLYYSFDGKNYQYVNTPSEINVYSMAFGKNKIVIVGATGAGAPYAYYAEATNGKIDLNPIREGNIDNTVIGRRTPKPANFTDISSNGYVNIVNQAGSVSNTTGALVVRGGVGIGGSLYVSSATAISGITINAGVITGSLTGLATTSTYSHQSGFATTSGFATSATSASIATTSYNVNVNSASSNSSHYLIFSPNATGSGVALSTESSLVYNPSTDILSVSGLAVTSSLGSTSTSTGALTVSGGVGIGGTLNILGNATIGGTLNVSGSNSYFQNNLYVGNNTQGRLFFSQATLGSAGTTVIPSMAFIGATNSPITLSVLPDNSLSFDGSSGQLFSINNNLSTGWIFSINDISGLPIFRTNADLNVAMGEYGGNVGIGLSNAVFKLQVVGNAGISGTTLISNTTSSTNTTSGALVVLGGVGIGESVNVGGRVGIGTNLLTGQINIRNSASTVPSIVTVSYTHLTLPTNREV